MFLRQDRHGVGADLVGGVAVGGDAVGADDHQIDQPLPHQRARHVVGDDRRFDAVPHQLPRREPGALQKRPRLVGQHRHVLARLDRGANDAERRPVAGGRERPGVAVREDSGLARHDRGTERPHRAATRHVLVVNELRLAIEAILDLQDRLAGFGASRERVLHPLDRPEQIHRRRPGRRHELANLVELGRELLGAARLAAANTDRNPHGRRDANRRGASDHHRLDGARHLGGGLAADVDFLRRQLALVDHHDDVVLAGNGRQHGSAIVDEPRGSGLRLWGSGGYSRRASNGSGSRSFKRWVPFSPVRLASVTSRSPPNSHRI